MSSPDDSRSDLDFGPTLRGFAANQRVFDRYVLREILGRGGMGIVWRAYDEQLECEVALKFLPELVAFDKQAVADLKRETRKTRELRHHHIVQVYDFVTDKHSACISMEYVDGPTLSAIKARKENGCTEVDEISEWVKQLCEALSYAHERAKIVHRDLKPANLMINGKSELKVTDFGIARSVSDSVSMLTMARSTSGTLVYMSPQQLDGERTSHLDDIYSLGATLYELLTSRPPFYSGGVERQIHEKTPPPIAQRREELDIASDKAVPPQWEATIAACLAKSPASRPQSAQEVARRLGPPEPLTLSATHKSTQPEILRDLFKAVLRRRKNVLAAALLTLLATGVIGGWWFGYKQPRREATSQPQLENAAQRAKTEGASKKDATLPAIPLATKEQPYLNSLGMKFVPVPGTRVLFSVWDTRVKDYRPFAEATTHHWPAPYFKQTGEHPAVNVNWGDAAAFCKWLTEKEQKTGLITASQSYRLPTDLEWSAAVGLEREEGSVPAERKLNKRMMGIYPWGTQWPPPQGAGNYHPSLRVDDYAETSPVGSFEANRYGLFDMGGNVLQWCEDRYDAKTQYRVLRGASWDYNDSGALLSSYRGNFNAPDARNANAGFRCVLGLESSR